MHCFRNNGVTIYFGRLFACALATAWVVSACLGQQTPDPSITPITKAKAQSTRFTKVSRGSGTLPNSGGQIWREYDIRPYVSRMKNAERPEQRIVDWILRDTGTDMWFRSPVGVLSANSTTLLVYHTPDIHKKVAKVVDRFVGGVNEKHAVAVRLITVDRADWREFAWPMLKPVKVNSPGIEAWLLEKEDAAVLLANLRNRPDFREHNSSNGLIRSGQSETLKQLFPRNYVQGVEPVSGNSLLGYQLTTGEARAGYSLTISPLVAIDAKTVDAAIQCRVDQIEKMTPITLNVPGRSGPQRVRAEVPQFASWSVHERFRWPVDKVLLVSRGIVAMPGMKNQANLISGLSKIVSTNAPRANALLMLECKQVKGSDGLAESRTDFRSGQLNYRGRY